MNRPVRFCLFAFLFVSSLPAAAGIGAITPNNGPTTGGTAVEIHGTGFGTSTGTVRIGAITCTVTNWTDLQIGVLSPPGQGALLEVVVTLATGPVSYTSAGSFSYHAPSILFYDPDHGPTTGGVPVSVSGTNFGLSGFLTFAGVTQSVSHWSHTNILFTLPAGGERSYIAVEVGGQTATLLARPFDYDQPYIDALSVSNGPVTGGVAITVTGGNFWTNATVLFNTATLTPVTVSDRSLTFVLPPGIGTNNPLSILRSNRQSAPVIAFRYDPSIPTGFTPNAGPTTGGTMVTVSGSFFGATGVVLFGSTVVQPVSWATNTVVFAVPEGGGCVAIGVKPDGCDAGYASGSFCYDPPLMNSLAPPFAPTRGGITNILYGLNFSTGGSVTVGGTLCSNVSWSHTQIRFIAPPGVGRRQTILVNASGRQATTNMYDYNPPLISGLQPNYGPAAGGAMATLYGNDLGPAGSLFFNDVLIPWQSWSNAQVKFVIPPGTGLVPVKVVVGGQTSSVFQFSFLDDPALSNFRAEPSSVSPTTGTCRVLFSVDVDPRGLVSEVVFEYGISTSYGGSTAFSGLLGTQTLQFTVAEVAAGLTYHWRAIASNAQGRSVWADRTVTLPAIHGAGDTDGDGRVDPAELGAVLSNYWSSGSWLAITNAARLGGALSFELDEPGALGFSVEYTTDHVQWTRLTNSTPAQLFRDPADDPQRAYRLRWP